MQWIVCFQAFVVFPWWFSVIHLFAVFTNEEADLEIHRLMLKRHRQVGFTWDTQLVYCSFKYMDDISWD